MALEIFEIDDSSEDSVRINFKLENKNDAIMVQAVMRSLISTNFCRESEFGKGWKGLELKDVLVFKYHFGKDRFNSLKYISDESQMIHQIF